MVSSTRPPLLLPSADVPSAYCVRVAQVMISDLPFRLLTARWGATLTCACSLLGPSSCRARRRPSSPLPLPSSLSLAAERIDTQMFHTSSLLDDPAFYDEAMRDLKLGRKMGRPRVPVVGQLAGDDPEAMGRAGALLVGLVDALGEYRCSLHKQLYLSWLFVR